jgi:hypothetical protein
VLTDEAAAAWVAAPRIARGVQLSGSLLAILTALTFLAVFRISPLGLTLRVPDHTTLSVCSATLARPRPQLNNTDKGDSAGGRHRPEVRDRPASWVSGACLAIRHVQALSC